MSVWPQLTEGDGESRYVPNGSLKLMELIFPYRMDLPYT
jgi:hypothetical protein